MSLHYVELHARSAFSFLRGSALPEHLAERAAQLDLPALAVCDRDGIYGAPRIHSAAKQLGIRAIVGAELTLDDGSILPVLAATRAGYQNLCRLITRAKLREPNSHTRAQNSPAHCGGTPLPRVLSARSRARPTSPAPNAPSFPNSAWERTWERSSAEAVGLGKGGRVAGQEHGGGVRGSERRTARPQTPLPWATELPAQGRSQTEFGNEGANDARGGTAHKAGTPVHWQELAEFADGLIALTGDEDGPIRRCLARDDRAGAQRCLAQLTAAFGNANVFVEIQRHLHRGEELQLTQLRDLAHAERLPLLATNGALYATREQRAVLDVLTCARNHTHLDAAGRLLAANDERHLKSAAQMARLFADLPEAIENTSRLAERVDFSLEKLGYEFPRYAVPDGETMDTFLRKMTMTGARKRYSHLTPPVLAQLDRELELIAKLGFSGYFLIVWDIVNFCTENNILVQGRGSAANSTVCYSLGITACDPIAYKLLFERFLSEGRTSWPDIDLDLPSGDRRERVIQEVYQRYGKHGAAMTANVITFRGRSAMREIGKALNFSPDVLSRFSSLYANGDFPHTLDLEAQIQQSGIPADHPRAPAALALYKAIYGMPRHLGQHSGGMIICQGQLSSIMPLEHASMPGRVVAQWDKDDCEDLGIIKVDLLGLGMMAVLQDTIELCRDRDRLWHTGAPPNRRDALLRVRQSAPARVPLGTFAPGKDRALERAAGRAGARPSVNAPPSSHTPSDLLAAIPPEDPATFEMMTRADTIGVFQIESRAQMATLPRMKPTRFYDVVVEVAIIRPGPIQGDMLHPYLARRAGKEPVVYMHPDLEPVLARTLGVPLFQEQLLKIAMVMAEFSGGEAEELRRALSFHRSHERMDKVCAKLRAAMERKNVEPAVLEQIVKSVQSFAVYGFPESHAISFALLAYSSAWLKLHRAPEFYAGLLNNQPMGFYSPATLLEDAKRHGVRVRPVSVLHSDWPCTIEPDDSLRLGLCVVRGLKREAGERIVTERNRAPFASLVDFQLRTALNKTERRVLAKIGALNGLAAHRRDALWKMEFPREPTSLFAQTTSDSRDDLPLEKMTLIERTNADFTGMGLTTGPHAIALIRSRLPDVWRAIDLPRAPNRALIRIAGAVICRQRPGTAKGIVFVSLEDETGIANAILSADFFETHRLRVTAEPFLLIEGIVQNYEGTIHIRAQAVDFLPTTPALTTAGSHDFH